MARGKHEEFNEARIVDFAAYKKRKQIQYIDQALDGAEERAAKRTSAKFEHPAKSSTGEKSGFIDAQKLGWTKDMDAPHDTDPTPPHGMPRPKTEE